MTHKEYKRKYNEITEWCTNELDKITEEIKKENKYIGLDGAEEKYQPIYNEYKNKLNKLKEEYKTSTY